MYDIRLKYIHIKSHGVTRFYILYCKQLQEKCGNSRAKEMYRTRVSNVVSRSAHKNRVKFNIHLIILIYLTQLCVNERNSSILRRTIRTAYQTGSKRIFYENIWDVQLTFHIKYRFKMNIIFDDLSSRDSGCILATINVVNILSK